MRFETPLALLLLPIIALLWWASIRRGRPRQAAIGYSDIALVRFPGAIRPAWEDRIPVALTALAMTLLVIALARPQHGLTTQQVSSNGIDMMLCLDTSGSMNAQDLVPTRVAAARKVSQQFVRERTDDRLGLVVFSAVAFTQCPLTTDHGALLTLLDSVKIGMTRTDGTAIGSAIATCINRLKDVPGKSKVIVLLTDGSNNAGEIDPLTAAKMAAKYGIKIYTIGMGTTGLAPMTVNDPVLGERTVMVRGDLDEGTLQKIADLTGGRFFRATDTEALAGVYGEINRLEKREAPKAAVVDYRELYPWFLLPALALLGLNALLERSVLQEVP
ncbi:MAG: VWA domain-containing protein [Proteobacteria bacterium]|nr:VWA domain-containing protein [Pseudomonadota bacterium]